MALIQGGTSDRIFPDADPKQTGVGRGTEVVVVASGGIVGIVAIAVRIDRNRAQAVIVGADVAVIAGIGGTGTGPTRTRVGVGADYSVITAGRIVGIVAGPITLRIQATQTVVIGADIAVITGIGGTGAVPIRTGVGMGTGYLVITGGRIVGVVAIAVRIDRNRAQADVVGADIGIVTAIGCSATDTSRARIRMGADDLIITPGTVHFVGVTAYARQRITGSRIMALIQSCAGDRIFPDADPELTGIGGGTKIIIVAGGRIRGVGAFPIAKADIIGADLTIIAGVGRTRTDTVFEIGADVVLGAVVRVITGNGVGGVGAGPIAIAFVVGAGISVYTVVGNTVTHSSSADIVFGTGRPIVTDDGVIGVVTFPFPAGIRRAQADIIGTDLRIITGIGRTHTYSR